MSQDGPQVDTEQPVAMQFTDASGTTYRIGRYLGGGMEGRTFLGTVVSLGNNPDPRLQVGAEVAVKQQPLTGAGTSLEEKKEILKREVDILTTEGSFFGEAAYTDSDQKQFMFMAIPLIKGKTLRDTLYVLNEKDEYVAKKPLTTEMKKKISEELLRDYFILNTSGILHVDIKPDNILVGLDGKPKVIDFGNSWHRDLFEEHPAGFQSPGALYAAPENYDDTKIKDAKCTPKADLYAVGILLASVWSSSIYEKEADLNAVKGNDALAARESLNDILGQNAQKPQDMPEDLWNVIRHLTAVDPNARPENIAKANGMRESTNPVLQDIVKAQARQEKVKQEISASFVENFREVAKAQGKEAVKFFDEQRKVAGDFAKPTEDFRRVHDYYKQLEVIAEQYNANPYKNPRKKFMEEYNKILTEMVNSGNEHFKAIAQKALAMEGTPDEKNKVFMQEYVKEAPKLLKDSFKEGTLEAQICNEVQAILNSSNDLATIRVGIHALASEVVSMSTVDQKNSERYKAVLSNLMSMINKIDNVRTTEARQLQGLGVNLPQIPDHPTPAQAPAQPRKKGVATRIRNYLLAILRDDLTRVATQMAREMQQTANRTTRPNAQPTQTTPSQETSPPIPTASNPLELRLSALLSSPVTLPPKKEDNPLDLSVKPTLVQLAARNPQAHQRPGLSNFAAKSVMSLISALSEVAHQSQNINTRNDSKTSGQKQKEALGAETNMLIRMLDYFRHNPQVDTTNAQAMTDLATLMQTAQQQNQHERNALALPSTEPKTTEKTEQVLRSLEVEVGPHLQEKKKSPGIH